MPAAYDKYDYPSYWKGREYEHKAELIAISDFLNKIPKIKSIIEIGAGFGRLTPTYLPRAKKVVLSDPSLRLLSLARKGIKNPKVKFIHSSLENLPKKIKRGSFNLVILVRVLHHIKDLDKALSTISQKILTKDGYFILEFANKRHLKATFWEFLKGNFTFPLDIFPKDIRTKKKKRGLPFINYHPDLIREKLKEHGFKIIEVRSVSNIRNQTIKKFLPLETLLFIEKHTQKYLSKIAFGPSIFILSQKKE